MRLTFTTKIIHWRGPSPFFFLPVPAEQSDAIKSIAKQVSYGWGVIPVAAHAGDVTWHTSLFPKDGLYLVPIKDSVRREGDWHEDDVLELILDVGVRKPREQSKTKTSRSFDDEPTD
jgi:Domain of unknown function (DUF1905)